MEKTFTTFQPRTIGGNNITEPRCFNGMCMIRNYKVTVEVIDEDDAVLEQRLRALWADKANSHSSNREAMRSEADKLGIKL